MQLDRDMDYNTHFEKAVEASRTMHRLTKEKVNAVLKDLALEIVAQTDDILLENQKDLQRMPDGHPMYDRLLLNPERLQGIAGEIGNVMGLESPLGEMISQDILPNGLQLSKVRVPLGVVGVIYEARPNVTVDVFALCFKTGNVAVLKGGSDAEASNLALIKVIHQVLDAHGIDCNVAVLLPSERESTAALLNAVGKVDVVIPRGSQSLISYVRQNSRIPVIETGAGIVHTYFDLSGDKAKAIDIIFNSKTRRVSVCNTIDCMIIHQGRLADLSEIVAPLASRSVILYADEESYAVLAGNYPSELLYRAMPDDFGTEFLDYKMAVKTVADTGAALAHIAAYSSKHSEAIIAEDEEQISNFLSAVDAAAVYANASTAFTDGGQFGLGAEIGISTQKLHARGPMGLTALTSYKWIIRGNGHIR